MTSALHNIPATIEPNNFKFKSLSEWSLNFFIGCLHACGFCYSPDTSANKQQGLLESYGVTDPVAEWGRYVLVRPWHERPFMSSLKKAEAIHPGQLKDDGNRAVFLCSTTDPYQVIRNKDRAKQKLLNLLARTNLRKALVAIRDHSTLNVRILTRSPLAREDFDIFKTFGDRLLLGTSLPTLDAQISELYETNVPAPAQRLRLLTDAHAAGIHTYVAVAPVFPEVGYDGMLKVFNAVKAANPWTIFMEPVNLRLGIAERIQREVSATDRNIDMTPYLNSHAWAEYAIRTLRDAERAAEAAGVLDRLHLWPDHDALGNKAVVARQPDPDAYLQWLEGCWHRVSEWPGKTAVCVNTTPVSFLRQDQP